MNFYVYLAKINNMPVYVGKGSKNRYRHCYKKWPNCQVEILKYFNTSKEAFLEEKTLIKKYGRIDNGTGILFNKNNGGEYITGAVYWKDKIKPNVVKDKISSSLKIYYQNHDHKNSGKFGILNNFFGKKHSEETKLRWSVQRKGRIGYFKGKKHSSESKEKNRLAHLGKPSPRKIVLDTNLIKKMYFEEKLSHKKISEMFSCSVTPVRRIINELKMEVTK